MKKAGLRRRVGEGLVLLAIVGAVLVASLLGQRFVPKVHAEAHKGCTVAGAAGTFGLEASGLTVQFAPIALVGILTSDPAGNIVAHETITVNGTAFPHDITGTITVNSDCSFTDTLSDGSTVAGVIVNGGRDVYFIGTSPGATTSGVAKRVGGSDED